MLPVLTADYYSITIVNIQRKSYTNERGCCKINRFQLSRIQFVRLCETWYTEERTLVR